MCKNRTKHEQAKTISQLPEINRTAPSSDVSETEDHKAFFTRHFIPGFMTLLNHISGCE